MTESSETTGLSQTFRAWDAAGASPEITGAIEDDNPEAEVKRLRAELKRAVAREAALAQVLDKIETEIACTDPATVPTDVGFDLGELAGDACRNPSTAASALLHHLEGMEQTCRAWADEARNSQRLAVKAQNRVKILQVELEQATAREAALYQAVGRLWGFWYENMLIAAPRADVGALHEAWDGLLVAGMGSLSNHRPRHDERPQDAERNQKTTERPKTPQEPPREP